MGRESLWIFAGHVVGHGCGHLAYLNQTDPTVRAAADHAAELWHQLGAHAPTLAGFLPEPVSSGV